MILETTLNLIGFIVGLISGIIAYVGYNKTSSPTLLRLTIAFFSIGSGFFIICLGITVRSFIEYDYQLINIAGSSLQTIGYFFIAFSHTIKSFFPKYRYFRAIPLFVLSIISIEHLIRSVSFILLIYASIETILSYLDKKKKNAIIVAMGLSSLAMGEFLGWYHFLFPESILYNLAIVIKITGLVLLFIPITKISLTKIKFDD